MTRYWCSRIRSEPTDASNLRRVSARTLIRLDILSSEFRIVVSKVEVLQPTVRKATEVVILSVGSSGQYGIG